MELLDMGIIIDRSYHLAIIRKYKISKIAKTLVKFKKENDLNKETVSYYKRLKDLIIDEVFENIFLFKKDNTTVIRIDRSYVYLNHKIFRSFDIGLINCVIADIYGEKYYRPHAFRIDMSMNDVGKL